MRHGYLEKRNDVSGFFLLVRSRGLEGSSPRTLQILDFWKADGRSLYSPFVLIDTRVRTDFIEASLLSPRDSPVRLAPVAKEPFWASIIVASANYPNAQKRTVRCN